MCESRSRARLALGVALAALAAAVGCQGSGFTVLGYQAGADALYDPNIKTVYVPLVVNRSFQTTPYRGFEGEITKAVVDEIGLTTRFKVVSDSARADTELQAVLVDVTKGVVNRNPQNATRQADVVVTLDVVWRDLRDGRILNAPRRPTDPATVVPTVVQPPPVPFDPTLPPPAPVAEDPYTVPTRIVAVGRLIPELGETNQTARTLVARDIAAKVVGLMEKPW